MPITRRKLLIAGAATSGLVAMPSIVKAQTREIVIVGGGAQGAILKEHFFSRFERSHKARILFEGSVSATNLEKIRANRNAQNISIAMIDDPFMVMADKDGLLEKLTSTSVPNVAKIDPTAVHRGGAWANFQAAVATIAFNSKALPNGMASWSEAWDPKFAKRIVIPSLRTTEGVFTLIMATHLETGLPLKEAEKELEKGFARVAALRPNLLTVYTNSSQVWPLLEQGEISAILSAPVQAVASRKAQGVPIDAVASPKEGAFAMPNGIALVKGGPNLNLAAEFVNELLGVEYQSLIAGAANANPVHPQATVPAGFVRQTNLYRPDWSFVAENRERWIERWIREIGA